MARCLGTFFGPDPFLSRVKCLEDWQSRQSPSDIVIQIMRYASRRTLAVVRYLHWTEMSHRGATISVLSVYRRFSPFPRYRLMQPTVIFPRSSVAIGRAIDLRTYVQDCARSLVEERKVVAGVMEWLMPGNCTSAG